MIYFPPNLYTTLGKNYHYEEGGGGHFVDKYIPLCFQAAKTNEDHEQEPERQAGRVARHSARRHARCTLRD